MAPEDVLEIVVRRHVFSSRRPFSSVLGGIFGGISQPDIGLLSGELAASTSYEQFSSLVLQAQGSAGLMRFLELDLDHAASKVAERLDAEVRSLLRQVTTVLASASPEPCSRQPLTAPDLQNGASACP